MLTRPFVVIQITHSCLTFRLIFQKSPSPYERESEKKLDCLNQKGLHPRELNILRKFQDINNEQIRNSTVSISNHFHEREM